MKAVRLILDDPETNSVPRCPNCAVRFPRIAYLTADPLICACCGHASTAAQLWEDAPVRIISAPVMQGSVPEGLKISQADGSWSIEVSLQVGRQAAFVVIVCTGMLVALIWGRIGSASVAVFVAIIGNAVSAVMMALGRVTIRSDGMRGVIFAGVGKFGSEQIFDVTQMRAVRRQVVQRGRHVRKSIVIDAGHLIEFGGLLTDEQRDYIIAWLLGARPPA